MRGLTLGITHNSYDRVLAADFMQTPSRADYPDYYKMIKKPMSLDVIKVSAILRRHLNLPLTSHMNCQGKLDNRLYQNLEDVHLDLNQLFVNAKRYNAAGSPIFLDAKKLHVRLRHQSGLLSTFD